MQTHKTRLLSLSAAAAMILLSHGTAAAQDPRSLADCETAYAQCFANFGFFGYFVCPQAYTQCVAQVRSTLPSEITQTLDQVEACSRSAAVCRTAAEGEAQKVASCSRREDLCVMDAFGVQPPPDSAKDMLCVQNALRCLNRSETAAGLGECGQSLRNCLAAPTPPL
jgi:hypothetical protein